MQGLEYPVLVPSRPGVGPGWDGTFMGPGWDGTGLAWDGMGWDQIFMGWDEMGRDLHGMGRDQDGMGPAWHVTKECYQCCKLDE